jgi:GT2 family glycosyltransferase
MKVSVVIASYRGASRLARLLPTIRQDEEAMDILVFDDGSPVEDSIAMSVAVFGDSPEARTELSRGEMRCATRYGGGVAMLRESTNRGYAHCVRDAVAATNGEIVLLLDDDTLIPPGFLRTLRDLYETMPGTGVLAWRSFGKNPGQSQRAVPGMLQLATQLASYCYAFPRAVWDEVGGFDTRYRFYCIDSDFAVRVTMAGHPCYRVWWPLVPHEEHGGEVDTVSFDRGEIGRKDSALFEEKWGASGDEMESRALASLLERAK